MGCGVTLADAASSLQQLRASHVEVERIGASLRFRPREAVPPDLLQRLSDNKPDLLVLLHAEAFHHDAGDGERPCISRCRTCGDLDFVRPRAGGAWRCARCRAYDLPGDDVEWWPRVEGPFASLDELLPAPLPTVPPSGADHRNRATCTFPPDEPSCKIEATR